MQQKKLQNQQPKNNIFDATDARLIRLHAEVERVIVAMHHELAVKAFKFLDRLGVDLQTLCGSSTSPQQGAGFVISIPHPMYRADDGRGFGVALDQFAQF